MILLLSCFASAVLSTACPEGSCSDSATPGSAQICSSGRWQEVVVAPWQCKDGQLAIEEAPERAAATKSSPISMPQVPTAQFFSSTTSDSAVTPPAKAKASSVPENSLAAMIYYPNYDVYDRNFPPESISNPQRFSHILYAFAKIESDGTVTLSDTWADLEKPADATDASSTKGAIHRLQRFRDANPHLKVLLSIGGWGYRSSFAAPTSTPEGIEIMSRTATQLVDLHGFDGLDVDWEYLSSQTEGDNFRKLLEAIRNKLNENAKAKGGPPPLLVAAVSPNEKHFRYLPMQDMDALLDYWLLMGYDYAGSFSKTAAHASNVYASKDGRVTPFNTHDGITAYKKHVKSEKIILGMPLYGRDFLNTNGLGSEYSGNSKGSWPDPSDDGPSGVWDYKAIPLNQTSVSQIDKEIIASWAYDEQTRTLISFDTPEVARLKGQYILDEKLGGAMWWEISGDRSGGNKDSLIDNVLDTFTLTE